MNTVPLEKPFDSSKSSYKLSTMIKTFASITLITSTVALSSPTQANNYNTATVWENIYSKSIRPCDSWRSSGRGDYVCAGYPWREDMPEARSVERVIRQLQREVDALKARVEELEATQN